MAKKVLYKTGDIVKIPISNNHFGFGRILITQSPALLIGFYDIVSNDTIEINSLKEKSYFIQIKCGDVGFKKKEWFIIGNIPLDKEIKLPIFWDKNALTNELYIRKYETTKDNPLGLGLNFEEKPTTEQEIIEKEAQPDGLCGWKAAEIKLNLYLKKVGKI